MLTLSVKIMVNWIPWIKFCVSEYDIYVFIVYNVIPIHVYVNSNILQFTFHPLFKDFLNKPIVIDLSLKNNKKLWAFIIDLYFLNIHQSSFDRPFYLSSLENEL